jgi:putative exporter of polyketide antibiotics
MANSTNIGLAAPFLAHARPFPAIVVGGLIVGALDLSYAIAVYSPHRPIRVPQTIASGILGMKSYSGGVQTAVLGVILHFVIALGAATVYYLASRKLTLLLNRAVTCGLIYGALVYLFMHIVVLPLSATPKGPTHFVYQSFEFVWHCFGVGLPIALSVRHYSS